jgi:hypothetical protein
MTSHIETRIVSGIRPADRTPRQIRREFRAHFVRGASLALVGEASDDPGRLSSKRYLPKHKIDLFDVSFYLTDPRYDDDIGFLVAYVVIPDRRGRIRRVHPRIFYKDLSLMWRVATHLVRDDSENWIGKGDVKWERRPDGEYLCSAEETSNLPFEIQGALDGIRGASHPLRDDAAVPLILRRARGDRIRPYADFTNPRRRAAERHRINGGRRVAWFKRRADPSSLCFARGFEPDFRRGVLEVTTSASELYGGSVKKFRILSANREIQYQFAATPWHVWLNPLQALTVEISTYGTRTVDVLADEDLFVPGYEYHYFDEHADPPALHSQIPAGFAGAESKIDPHRADASAWIENLPVIARFRREVLEKGATRRHRASAR